MRFLGNEDVMQVLTPAMARQALEEAYLDLATGDAVCRPRIDVRIPTTTPNLVYQWGTMEGGSTRGYFAIRMKSDVVYDEHVDGRRSHEKFASRPGLFCGLIFLTDVDTGEPLAIMNDGFLQHARVAADSAIGTHLMARENASSLAMIGSGGMARSHVEALLQVRDLSSIRVYSPTVANRERFAAEIREKHCVDCVAVETPEDACAGADILAACTDSATPVIQVAWLAPGMHVISIGGRPEAAAKARFDRTLRLGTAPSPVGRPDLGTADEYLGYVARPDDVCWRGHRMGRAAPRVTGDSGDDIMYADIVAGRATGRTDDMQITYSERGNIQGAQFYAIASRVYEAAVHRRLGREIPTEWFLQTIRD